MQTTRGRRTRPPRDTSRPSWPAITIVAVLGIVAAALAVYAVVTR